MNMLRSIRGSLLHPLDFFYDIQFDNRARLRNAVIIVAIAVFSKTLVSLLTGFSFNDKGAYQISVFNEALWIVLPWLTWSVSSWAVGAIVDGEGKFKHILISSAYVFIPYILFNIPFSIISNVLTHKELPFIVLLDYGSTAWMLFILLVTVKVLHDFELGKTIWVTLLSLFGVLLIWFVCIMIFGLVNQSVQFLVDLYKEISYRS